jgi:peptidyl-prolyl cis-trans isomerase D
MLRGIRKASGNWLGKLVMGIVVGTLAISFAIWGVGDIFRGFGRSTLASVGSTEITVEQFRVIYNERLQQLGAQVGRPIPADQARALQLDRQILGQVIADAALDERARRLGLGITDAEVARQIREIPAFRGPSGQFEPEYFQQRIRSAGYTEPRFVAEQRRLMIRQHLTQSIGDLTAVPKTFVEALNKYQNERRTAEYVVLDRNHAGELADPTPEQIAGYFESRKSLFRAPEYRRLVLVKLTPADLAKWITVSDEEAKKAYEERRSRYQTPGRRQLQQIFFINEEEARKASERITSGVPFETIASERGLTEKEMDLGLVEKAALSTSVRGPAFAEAAFSLPEGAVSAPVKTGLGAAIIRVLKVEPDRTRTFEEAAAEIKQEIARDRTRSETNEKHDKIEDERAGGQTLLETAQKVGLAPEVIEAVDRSGRDPTGAPVVGLPPEVDVLGAAFKTDVGVEADALRLPGDGYLWFEVTAITPSKERTLEEVKDQVEARWREEQIGERLKAKSAELIDKLKGGAALADVAGAENLKTETAGDLNRGASNGSLSAAAVSAVFATGKGQVGVAEGIIFRVTDISVPAIDATGAQGKQIEDSLRGAVGQDLLAQYVSQVERDLGAKINADALRRVAGGENAGGESF